MKASLPATTVLVTAPRMSKPSKMLRSTRWRWVRALMVKRAGGVVGEQAASEPTGIAPLRG